MEVKELARRIHAAYMLSLPLCGNQAELYGNDVPICLNVQSALQYISGISPGTFDKIQQVADGAKEAAVMEAAVRELEPLADMAPEELKPAVESIINALPYFSPFLRP